MEQERLVEAGENIRKEAAALLHGNVQSTLAACTMWLSMVEDLLPADEGRKAVHADVAAVAKAAGLLGKVRRELARLYEEDVPRAVRMLYPLLIGVGLGPALAGLVDGLVRADGGNWAVEISTDDSFSPWDRPTSDGSIIRGRLEVYRIVEGLYHVLARSGLDGVVRVRLHVDEEANEQRLVSELRLIGAPDGDEGNGRLEKVLSNFVTTGPAIRFARVGGHLHLGDDTEGGLLLSASLPLGPGGRATNDSV